MKISQQFSEKQLDAFKTLDDSKIKACLYGGSKGGGKSVFGCFWMWSECIKLIKKYSILPSKYPAPVAFMGRKQSVDFNDTTLETWKAFIPEDTYEIRIGDKEIVILDAVKINFGGLDSSDAVKKFNSAEYIYIFIDQAEEISRNDYGLVRGTLRRKIDNEAQQYKVLLTANPADCWLKDDFITTENPENAFIQALPADNPFLPGDYIDNLKEAFRHRPELIDAYVYGKWDVIAGFDLVIKPSWVENAIDLELHKEDERIAVCCDPARMGNDETVIYVMKGYKVIDEMIYGQKTTMETAGHLVRLKQKHKTKECPEPLIAVDGCNLGCSIADRLRELKHKCLIVRTGSTEMSDSDKLKYKNLKSKLWWGAGEKFANEEVSLHNDKVLRSQLCTPTYKQHSEGCVVVESSDDIKKKMNGKSLDRACAYLIGLYAIDKVVLPSKDYHRNKPFKQNIDRYGWKKNRSPYAIRQ
ncbi:MAG: phage terminase large subunit [Nanoarchaeota archaeon]|nr:phage terminase large subunit [Nanoarchaeota archaeon]